MPEGSTFGRSLATINGRPLSAALENRQAVYYSLEKESWSDEHNTPSNGTPHQLAFGGPAAIDHHGRHQFSIPVQ